MGPEAFAFALGTPVLIALNQPEVPYRAFDTAPELSSRLLQAGIDNAYVYQVRKKGAGQFKHLVAVGRNRSSDIPLPISSVSRHHAFFFFERDGRLMIQDARSSHGTSVNGVPVEAKQPKTVGDADIVTFGDRQFRFYAAAGFAQYLAGISEKAPRVAAGA